MYIHEITVHNTNAAEQTVPFIIQKFQPKSLLDVGCGIGTWLKVFKENGVVNIKGIDGNYVNREQLFNNIDEKEFQSFDLSKPFNLNERFDLLICLEVAEHLPLDSAEEFIDSLIIHADTIIFGAAVPGQWGQNHLNEQWTEYWISLFNKKGYHVYDGIRPHIWNNDKVEWWYKQNMLVFSKHPVEKNTHSPLYQSIIHPYHFDQKLKYIHQQNEVLAALKLEFYQWQQTKQGVRHHWACFLKALLNKIYKKNI